MTADGRANVRALPSTPRHDAIALAVRSDAPIFADDSVIEESAIEFEHEDDVNEEQMVEEFKKFLDDVKPDDFIPEA